MAWLSVYREAAGWLVLTQAACLAAAAWLIARARKPQVGDDVIAMHARWRDEQVTAELERILGEGDGNG